MTAKRQLVLGLLFLSALSILAFYTLFLTDFTLFGTPELMRAQFPDAHGLRKGDAVLVSGMRLGRVKELAFDPEAESDKRITVTINLDQPIRLREGFEIKIEEATLLGGRNINIDPGPAGAPNFSYSPETPLQGSVESDPFQALNELGELVASNRSAVTDILNNLDAIVEDLRGGKGTLGRLLGDEELGERLKSAVTGFSDTMANASALTGDMKEGKGVLGRLIYDQLLSDQIAEAVGNLNEMTSFVNSGEGSLGKLIRDDKIALELEQALRNAREISEQINSGQGPMGVLLRDEQLAADVQKVVRGLAQGEGTLGALLTTDDVYQSLRATSDDVAAVVSALRSGQGSLGRLIMEADLYEEVLTSVQLLNRSLEDYREAAPVSAFTSVLFGAF